VEWLGVDGVVDFFMFALTARGRKCSLIKQYLRHHQCNQHKKDTVIFDPRYSMILVTVMIHFQSIHKYAAMTTRQSQNSSRYRCSTPIFGLNLPQSLAHLDLTQQCAAIRGTSLRKHGRRWRSSAWWWRWPRGRWWSRSRWERRGRRYASRWRYGVFTGAFIIHSGQRSWRSHCAE
jgi:hypothetical protein